MSWRDGLKGQSGYVHMSVSMTVQSDGTQVSSAYRRLPAAAELLCAAQHAAVI